ncbi:GNAT family N-acetyltransferase [Brachybacterium subflavum]|uniref:GNAT family N-acetyltransferase n=1 Tax=Brachybacterium subflavum TaxID=2585206 RepID=UPI0018796213|nr:GNAT family N-acetyltransferase [Brachybacterium subflavum]
MGIAMRRAVPGDEQALRRAVFAAWRWRGSWDEAAYRAHEDAGDPDSYVDGFGTRAGDAGLVAIADSSDLEICGAAWFRLFTRQSARAGFVADTIPELVLAVDERVRGVGIGGGLIDQLLVLARELGFPALSLHADAENSVATALYRSRGFEAVRTTPNGSVMVRADRSRNCG